MPKANIPTPSLDDLAAMDAALDRAHAERYGRFIAEAPSLDDLHDDYAQKAANRRARYEADLAELQESTPRTNPT